MPLLTHMIHCRIWAGLDIYKQDHTRQNLTTLVHTVVHSKIMNFKLKVLATIVSCSLVLSHELTCDIASYIAKQ